MKMFDADKTRMIGLPYAEKKLSQYVKPFSSNPETSRTDGWTDSQTDRRTELLYQYRASVILSSSIRSMLSRANLAHLFVNSKMS